MERQSALVLIIFIWFLFYLLAFFGARLTMLAAIVFSTFISLILLLIFYPPNQVANDDADFTLIIYGVLLAIGIIILAFYVFYGTLTDVREC